MHFDYHARKNHTDIGINFDEKVLDEMLETVKPDFVQCDTKGHPGISSYPTKVGNTAPKIHTDILRKWRNVTEKHNIPLYRIIPEYGISARQKSIPSGQPVDHDGYVTDKMSVFGDFAEKMLIPQLKEIALDIILTLLLCKRTVNIYTAYKYGWRAPRLRRQGFYEIPPLCNIKVLYKCGKPPLKVTLLPENKAAQFSYRNGILEIGIAKLTIHFAAELAFD